MVNVVRTQISGRARHLPGSSTPLRSPQRGRVARNPRAERGVAVRLPRPVRPFSVLVMVPSPKPRRPVGRFR